MLNLYQWQFIDCDGLYIPMALLGNECEEIAYSGCRDRVYYKKKRKWVTLSKQFPISAEKLIALYSNCNNNDALFRKTNGQLLTSQSMRLFIKHAAQKAATLDDIVKYDCGQALKMFTGGVTGTIARCSKDIDAFIAQHSEKGFLLGSCSFLNESVKSPEKPSNLLYA